jgi:hypothetical protein
MSVRLTIMLVAAIVIASTIPATAQPNCQTAIADFRFVINTETSMGHVTQTKQADALAELARISQTCRGGRNVEALAALQALQRRLGFR